MEVQVLSWAVIEKLEEHSRQIMFVLKFDNLNLELVSDFVLRISDFSHFALDKYDPSSVLILKTSPTSINGGTRVLSPVSSVASFI